MLNLTCATLCNSFHVQT